ncbi:MAG: hypothetical protein HOJ57_28695 [Lentisphaerae bacterium]|jgi:hypothetical protein|nr:hypothetical protein [Lentisphaerota bacterium]
MSIALTKLLGKMDAIIDGVSSRADHGFNTFPFGASMITDWNTYVAELARFFCHVECAILDSGGREVNLKFDFWRCCKLLQKDFGRNSDKAVFELVRTGYEGGMLKVLKSAARRMAEDYADKQILVLVSLYWERRSPNELFSDATEYIKQYGALLPEEFTEGAAARIRTNFFEVLKQHPHLMQRMRQIGR